MILLPDHSQSLIHMEKNEKRNCIQVDREAINKSSDRSFPKPLCHSEQSEGKPRRLDALCLFVLCLFVLYLFILCLFVVVDLFGELTNCQNFQVPDVLNVMITGGQVSKPDTYPGRYWVGGNFGLKPRVWGSILEI